MTFVTSWPFGESQQQVLVWTVRFSVSNKTYSRTGGPVNAQQPELQSKSLSLFRLWVRSLVAPALLTLVAVNQIQMTKTSDLTPWKGGGFGMFSTIDGPTQRSVRVWLETESGPIPLKVPEKYKQLVDRLASSPSGERAIKLAHTINQHSWISEDIIWRQVGQASRTYQDNAEARLRLLHPGQVELKDAPSIPLGVENGIVIGASGSPNCIPHTAVRVEVWSLRFEQTSKKMWDEKLLGYTTPVQQDAEPSLAAN